jgi:hypothetical protein
MGIKKRKDHSVAFAPFFGSKSEKGKATESISVAEKNADYFSFIGGATTPLAAG